MRKITQHEVGGPEVLRLVEADRPTAGPGEVLVRVRAIGVNPADWKIRAGKVTRFGPPPFTVGLDFAGDVAELGAGVTGLRVGEPVYGMSFPPNGTYAEYLAVPADRLAPAPAGTDHVRAAALPTAGLTAWQPLVRVAEVKPGQRVLVHAAAGGVGHLAVQIAKARGAYVLGTARADKHGFLRDLGADELIDYTATDFATAVHDVDVVLDLVGWAYSPRSVDTLAAGGILIDVTGSAGSAEHRAEVRDRIAGTGLRFTEFAVSPNRGDLDAVAAMVSSGQVTPTVAEVLPWSEAARAHELGETNRVAGKIVLTVD